MSGRIISVLAFLILGLAELPVCSQIVEPGQGVEGEPPAAPASRVLDDGGLFQRDRRRLAVISERLVNFGTEENWPVYLAVYAGLLDTTPDERAAVLHREWIGEQREGLVIVLETDSRHVGLGRSLELADAETNRGSLWQPRVAPYEIDRIRADVEKKLVEIHDPLELADRLTAEWVDGLTGVLEKRQAGEATGDRMRFALIVVGAACLLGLLALLAARMVARADARRRLVHRLPDVRVEMRLGAPYGGGRVSTRSFRGSANNR